MGIGLGFGNIEYRISESFMLLCGSAFNIHGYDSEYSDGSYGRLKVKKIFLFGHPVIIFWGDLMYHIN